MNLEGGKSREKCFKMEEVLSRVSNAAKRLRERKLNLEFRKMTIIGDPHECHFGEVLWREAGLERV